MLQALADLTGVNHALQGLAMLSTSLSTTQIYKSEMSRFHQAVRGGGDVLINATIITHN